MSDFNNVTLSGRLGSDPQSIMVGESLKASFSLAFTKHTPNASVESGFDEATSWIAIEGWTYQAEKIMKNCRKGTKIMLTGELSEDVWKSDDPKKPNRKMVIKILSFEVMAQPKSLTEQPQSAAPAVRAPQANTVAPAVTSQSAPQANTVAPAVAPAHSAPGRPVFKRV